MKVDGLAADAGGPRYFIEANAMKAALFEEAAADGEDPSTGRLGFT